jgi:RNA polymerase sigma factor (sigma-70 family)
MRLPSPERFDPALDERLIERCRRGDARAWAAIVRRYERLVYAVARGYRLDPEDLADVFQEVFAALVRGLPRLRDARTLCRWLSRTTDRLALATALRRRRERAREAGPPELARLPELPDPTGVDLERLEQQMLVRLALAGLGARCRALLEALYFAHPTPAYSEVSRSLGLPVGSIGPTRARCLEKLTRDLRALEMGPERISAPGDSTSPDRGSDVPPARPRRAASLPALLVPGGSSNAV